MMVFLHHGLLYLGGKFSDYTYIKGTQSSMIYITLILETDVHTS